MTLGTGQNAAAEDLVDTDHLWMRVGDTLDVGVAVRPGVYQRAYIEVLEIEDGVAQIAVRHVVKSSGDAAP